MVRIAQFTPKVPVLAHGKGLQALLKVFRMVQVEARDPESLLDRLRHPDVVHVVLVQPKRVKCKDRIGLVLAEQIHDPLAQCDLRDVGQAVCPKAQLDDL